MKRKHPGLAVRGYVRHVKLILCVGVAVLFFFALYFFFFAHLFFLNTSSFKSVVFGWRLTSILPIKKRLSKGNGSHCVFMGHGDCLRVMVLTVSNGPWRLSEGNGSHCV